MFRMIAIWAFGSWFSLSAALGQGVITGQVTDETGEPLAGANVYVEEVKKGATANEKGVYRIQGLAPGKYRLRFSFVGYERVFRLTTVQEGTSQTILHVQMTEKVIDLEPLSITAIRAGKKAPFTYTNLKKSDLEENNTGQDVPFLLQYIPSAVATSDAGTGIGYTGIRIRGSDATRINITINGIPLNDAESQAVYWVNLPDFISSTEDVQIQRGVGTSTNGAGAFGASINLNTAGVRPAPFVQLSALAGSFDTWRTSLQFGSGLLHNRFSVEGRLSRIASAGYIDRASADLRSWFLSGVWLGDKSSLRVNAFSGSEVTYQAWYGVPRELAADRDTRTFNPAGTERPGAPYDNETDNYTQSHYQALYNLEISRNWRANAALHYTRGLGYFEQYKAAQNLGGYGLDSLVESDLIRRLWLDNHFYGITYGAHYVSNGSRLHATLGGGWNQYLGEHYGEIVWAQNMGGGDIGHLYYENDAQKTDLNVFAKAQYELAERWSAYLDIQYRHVAYSFLGIDENGNPLQQEVELAFLNPKAGLFFQPSPGSQIYASFAVGGREPNRNDYVAATPDNLPRAERLYNTELGWSKTWKKGRIGANIYHMYYQDQLALTGELNLVGEYIRANVPESYRLGIEWEGGWRIAGPLELSANLALSRNRIGAFTEFIDLYNKDFEYLGQEAVERDGADLSFSPAVIGGGELAWSPFEQKWQKTGRMLEFALLGKYVGPQYVDNSSSEASRLEGFFNSDLRCRFGFTPKAGPEVEFNLQVRNLFNSLYANNGWAYRYRLDGADFTDMGVFPQATRHFLLGVQVRL